MLQNNGGGKKSELTVRWCGHVCNAAMTGLCGRTVFSAQRVRKSAVLVRWCDSAQKCAKSALANVAMTRLSAYSVLTHSFSLNILDHNFQKKKKGINNRYPGPGMYYRTIS